VQQNEISVTVFFRDPSTFIAFAGDTVKLPRNASIDAMLGDAEAESSAPRAGPTSISSRRQPHGRVRDDDEERSPVFRPGSQRRAAIDNDGDPKAVPVPTLASGTELAGRLIEPIYSDYARQGQRFRASLDQDLVQDGKVIATQRAASDPQKARIFWFRASRFIRMPR